MLQEVAMVWKCPRDRWIAEIHAELDTRKLPHLFRPVRYVHCVIQEWFLHRSSVLLEQLKMDLVYMKRVQFERAILDHPIFYVANMRNDVRKRRGRLELFWLLTVHGD